MTKDNAAACMPVKQRLSVLALGWTLLLLATAAFLGAEDLRTTFNSDIYYLPVLVKDVLHMGGSLAEWRLPPAPYFFPDLPLFLAARFVTGSAIAGLALAGASHYIIFIGGWFALAGRFARNENSRFASQTAVLALGILGMVLGSLRYVAYASTQITVHFGVMAVAPWVILLADIFLSGEKRRNRALAGVTLFFVTGALTASDMLSVTQILMPSLCAMLLLAITAKASWKTISIAWLCMGSGAAVGANMLRWFGKASLTGYIRPDLIHSSDATRAFIRWITELIQHQPAAALLAIVFLSFHAVLLVVYLSRACRAQTLDARQLLLSAFVASAVPLNIIAVLIMGNFFSSADARYALSFMFYPLFSAPVLLAGIQIPSAASRRLAPCAALLLAACAALDAAALTKLGGLKRYAEHYPEWVEWADTEMTARGLTEGAANYWDTKEMILLSRSNLRLVQSTEYLVPYNWISNTRWYDRFTPRFFLCSTNPKRTDRVQESSVTAKFGEPMERLVHGERSILIYPEESGLTHWYRDHPMRQEFLGVGDAAVFAAAELPGDIGEDGASSRIAEPPARPGSVTLGPYILMPKGSYRAVIRYSATPGPDYLTSGYWQLREVIRTEPRLIREAPLDPAKNEAVIEFDLAKRSSVELLTSYTGSGILEVISISFERTR